MGLGLVVEVRQVGSAGFGVALEVEVGAVGDAFQFAPAEGELVFDVGGGLGVVRQFLGVVGAQAQAARIQTQLFPPGKAGVDPVLVGRVVLARLDEVLQPPSARIRGYGR